MTGPITHCDTCKSPHLATRPCQHCTRRARAAEHRADLERQRVARAERANRAAKTRKLRAREPRVSASGAERIAAMAGAFDGEQGLEPATEGRFQGHGGRRAWRAYERAYREAR